MDQVHTWDIKRSYVVMDAEKWYWATIKLPKSFRYKTGLISEAKSLLLLHDLRGGEDGRVWMASTLSGAVCTIKFAQKIDQFDTPADFCKRLNEERDNWKRIWNLPARVQKLGGDYALIMPYLKPVDKAQFQKKKFWKQLNL